METTTYNSSANQGFSNPGDDALNRTSASAHGAINTAADAADKAARKAGPAIDRVAAKAHQAVDKAVEVAAPAAEWLSQQGESLNATQQKLLDDTCKYVAANPLKSIGFAVLAGVVLGRILLK
jgi:ElaB/YqjD/DUF883 family membrane-anchored ribosome-binding protein